METTPSETPCMTMLDIRQELVDQIEILTAAAEGILDTLTEMRAALGE